MEKINFEKRMHDACGNELELKRLTIDEIKYWMDRLNLVGAEGIDIREIPFIAGTAMWWIDSLRTEYNNRCIEVRGSGKDYIGELESVMTATYELIDDLKPTKVVIRRE